jgi:ubiquinone/menaquinone biosynthesis C-methylase UbiE
MPGRSIDYSEIAERFDERYDVDALSGVAAALLELAASLQAQSILEVGCGTGHWLAELSVGRAPCFGVDYSLDMLRQARRRSDSFRLMRGRAGRLPLRSASFDLVFCVNAIHQFDRQREFLREARRLLRPGGALAVVGMDLWTPLHSWYVHDYFPTALSEDLERFPSPADLGEWAAYAGFALPEWRSVQRIQDRRVGREVFDAPFLKKESCSQLAAMSEEEYREGLRRIEEAVAEAEREGVEIAFVTDLHLEMLVAGVGEKD